MMDTATQNLLSDGTVTMPLEKFQMILDRMRNVDSAVAIAKMEAMGPLIVLREEMVQMLLSLAYMADMSGAKVPCIGTNSDRTLVTFVSNELNRKGYSFTATRTGNIMKVVDIIYTPDVP